MTDDDLTYTAFISYASEDRDAAFEVCDRLESAGLNCWIAPRDVRAGQDYGAEIIRGIERSSALVLVLSQHSNGSKFVKAEVERAYSKDKAVFPVRIEEVMPASHLELFVSSSHWVDAFQGNLDDHFTVLIKEISAAGGQDTVEKGAASSESVKRSKLGKSRSPVPLIALGTVAVVAIGLFLWQLGKSPGESTEEAAPENSVAILPFLNMSSDPEQEYFSDGIAEELLNILSQVQDLKVAARTSSFQFKGENLDVGSVGVQLNVAHVLEGSVRKAGNRVRITAQLIDADTGYNLWSENFDRELVDVFAIQDEISHAIVAAMKEVLKVDEMAPLPLARASGSTEAYDQYLLGQHLMHERSKESITAAESHFRRATEIDPAYAPAYAGLSIATMLLMDSSSTYGDLSPEDAESRAMPAALRAIELDPNLAEAYAALGFIHYAKQEFDDALLQWDKAVEINPNFAVVQGWRGVALLATGQVRASLVARETAAELDPLSVNALNNYAGALFAQGRHEDSAKVLERMRAISPPNFYYMSSWLAYQKGQTTDAMFFLMDGFDLDPESRRIPQGFANMFGLMGVHEEAVRHSAQSIRWLPYQWNSDFDTMVRIGREDHEANPANRYYLLRYGIALLAAGQVDESMVVLEQYLGNFNDGAGPDAFPAGYVALYRQANSDADGADTIHKELNRRLQLAVEGGVDDNPTRQLRIMVGLLEGRQDDALDALDDLSRGSGVQPDHEASLRYLTNLGDEPRFVEILAAQATRWAAQREKLMARICGDENWQEWDPLPSTCEGWQPAN
jgi:TolB-like protein/tetratricopeptide (TPR) repeat protein